MHRQANSRTRGMLAQQDEPTSLNDDKEREEGSDSRRVLDSRPFGLLPLGERHLVARSEGYSRWLRHRRAANARPARPNPKSAAVAGSGKLVGEEILVILAISAASFTTFSWVRTLEFVTPLAPRKPKMSNW